MTLISKKNIFLSVNPHSSIDDTLCVYCGCPRSNVVKLPSRKDIAALKCSHCDTFLKWVDLPKTEKKPATPSRSRPRKRRSPKESPQPAQPLQPIHAIELETIEAVELSQETIESLTKLLERQGIDPNKFFKRTASTQTGGVVA